VEHFPEEEDFAVSFAALHELAGKAGSAFLRREPNRGGKREGGGR
jgi:hypothetical protein